MNRQYTFITTIIGTTLKYMNSSREISNRIFEQERHYMKTTVPNDNDKLSQFTGPLDIRILPTMIKIKSQ